MTCPCNGCEFRHQACWGDCSLYLEFKAENDKRREEEAKKRPARDFLADGVRKAKAITNRKRRK